MIFDPLMCVCWYIFTIIEITLKQSPHLSNTRPNADEVSHTILGTACRCAGKLLSRCRDTAVHRFTSRLFTSIDFIISTAEFTPMRSKMGQKGVNVRCVDNQPILQADARCQRFLTMYLPHRSHSTHVKYQNSRRSAAYEPRTHKVRVSYIVTMLTRSSYSQKCRILNTLTS